LWYAKYLAIVGRKDEVLIHRRIAAELDPISPYAVQAVGGYLSVAGHYDEAIEQFLSALALDPNFGLAHQGLGVAYLLKGMPAQAIDELQKADRLMSGPRRRALLGYAYGVAGNTFAAHRILSEFLKQSTNEQFPALAVAQVYLGLGDKDHAFEWLEKAIDQRDLDVTLQWDSPYESLRSDPRFPALLRRMQLAN
jgi:tetratricopeptide (TPR) repeat protein